MGLGLVAAVLGTVVIAAVSLSSAADSPWNGSPEVYQVGRLDAAARSVPVKDAAAALDLGAHEAEQASPWLLSLDGEWRFRWSPSAAEAGDGFADPSVDVSAWDAVEVPHHWQLDGYGDERTGDLVYLNEEYPWDGYGTLAPPEVPTEGNSAGAYRRDVDIPADWGDRRIVLAFQGVKSAYTVWVNGVEVGYSENSYSPAEFDVTGVAHAGMNTVAVLVHRWSDGSWLENQDQIDLSGIFREVELYSTPLTYVRDHTVTTDVADNLRDATVTAELDVVSEGADEGVGEDRADAEIRTILHDAAGAVVGEAAGASAVIEVPDARLWSAEDPHLYTLIYEVLDGGEVIETVATRVGIREFGIVDGLMTLNGRPLDIKGVNRSEMHPDTGQALTEEQTRADLLLMRQHNITAVRTSHYPASPALYRLADEIGMYVMDEANLETHELRPFPDGAPEWDGAVMDRIVALHARDKNHPSVLWWSLGNEIGPGEIFQEAADWLRSVDPTRLVHFQEDSAVADIDGVFYPYLSTLEERAAVTTGRPWIMTEYQHALGASLGGIEEFWEVIDSSPEMQGGFVWQWADQSIRMPLPDGSGTYLSYGTDWSDYPTDGAWTLNGIVNPDRVVQPELVDLAAVYAPVELVGEDLGSGRVQLRNEHLFTDLAALDARWVLEADGVEVDSGPLEVALAPGETGWVDVPIVAPEAPVAGATYRVRLTFALASATAWAEAGHVVAALQATMPWDTGVAAPRSGVGPVELSESPAGVTVTGEGFAVVVDARSGALTSYQVDGVELLAEPSHPDFWRAPTPNDQMNGLTADAQGWRGAGEALEDVAVTAARTAVGAVEVRVSATVPATGGPSWDAVYTVTGDGAVGVNATLGATSRAFEIPAVGLELALPARLDRLTWLGDGPHETWRDRRAGALTSVWESTVEDQVVDNVAPQAMGNHTGVEWWAVTDASGAGLMVSATGSPLEVSALPMTEEAIEAAGHPHEIARDGLVHLSVDAVQQGLGLSWGERALPFATVRGDEPHTLAFTLAPLRAGDDPGAAARALASVGRP